MQGRISEGSKIVGLGRSAFSQEDFVDFCFEAIQLKLLENDGSDSTSLNKSSDELNGFKNKFASMFHYVCLDFTEERGYADLRRLFAKIQPEQPIPLIFYLSTHSSVFLDIVKHLGQLNLLEQARVVIEKPIGDSYESALAIEKGLGEYLREKQIFRIDHYLGKESVQNLLALRFGNSFMESLWSRNFISHVEISAAEQVGVGHRGEFLR